jgi:hypothetical protein
VGLSNGDNFIEGSKPFDIIPYELSPWLRLLQYLAEHDLSITSLSLIYKDRTFNLPSSGSNPKFKAFYDAKKPISYNFMRIVGGTPGENTDLFAVIEAVYKDYSLQLWVDEKNPENTWVLSR